jgi:hypothetical protein
MLKEIKEVRSSITQPCWCRKPGKWVASFTNARDYYFCAEHIESLKQTIDKLETKSRLKAD